MKNVFKTILIVSNILVLSSCNTKSKEENVDHNDSINLNSNKDSISTTPKPEVSKTIIGKVASIEYGKDGYTAKVVTPNKEEYYVTISHSNLLEHKEYRSFKVDDDINVTGIFWQIENTNQITVKKIN